MKHFLQSRAPLTVSFSGIDGAGKSTQIENLRAQLNQLGLEVLLLRFWDDVAQFTRLREDAGHTFFKGDKGVGTPAAPIERRDKNVQSWPMTLVRLFFYFADALSLRAVMKQVMRSKVEVAIFDRYLYDELANLKLANPLLRSFVRVLVRVVPRPHISFLLDADPLAARARKPEYPLEFLYTNRQAYLALSHLIGGMTLIPPSTIEAAQHQIQSQVLDTLHAPGNATGAGTDSDSCHSRSRTRLKVT